VRSLAEPRTPRHATVAEPATDVRARAWLEVDLAAVRRNAERLAAHLGTRLAPVLKADAYGLGAPDVAHALEATAPWGYCVGTLDEAAALRGAGIARPILHCPPLAPDEVRRAVAVGVTPALGTAEAIGAWKAAGGGDWHLAIDTGMQRAGVRWDRIAAVREAVAAHPPGAAFTHFHSADRDDDTMAEQERRFAAAIAELPARPPLVHTDNSAAAARRPAGQGWGDFARPGLFLYGVGTGNTARVRPDPVVAVRTRIVELRDVEAGETVSYEGTWRAPGPRRIATVPLGYADGIRRTLGNRGWMLVRGRRAPIAGWVTMDMTMLDVTDCAAEVGDVVTAVGTDGEHVVGLELLAGLAECSPYELLVALRLRLPRLYHPVPTAP
jgi:alanine racemase